MAGQDASIKTLTSKFRSDPNVRFSLEELAILERAAEQDIWAAKALALRRFHDHAYEDALRLCYSILQREVSTEDIKNTAVILRLLKRYQEAIAFLDSYQDRLDQVAYLDLKCSLYSLLGNIAAATECGTRSLEIKDSRQPVTSTLQPSLHSYDPNMRSRNVLSYSIWGSDPRYLKGAMTNAIVARYLYPGWSARFYTDHSTPEQFRAALAQNGARVILVEDMPANQFGLFWRFLVEDDPEVAIYLVRDADSVCNIKERAAVADWLNAGTAFHVMRDNPWHSELILAGMWGAHRGNIGNMRDRITRYVASAPLAANDTTIDQRFLREIIWPIARQSLTTHDRFFKFMNPRRYDASFELPHAIHIGQNDWIHYKQDPGPSDPQR